MICATAPATTTAPATPQQQQPQQQPQQQQQQPQQQQQQPQPQPQPQQQPQQQQLQHQAPTNNIISNPLNPTTNTATTTTTTTTIINTNITPAVVIRPTTIITNATSATTVTTTTPTPTTTPTTIISNNISQQQAAPTVASGSCAVAKTNHHTNIITTEDLDSFFEKKLYNECQAIEELIRSIELSQNEALPRRALILFQSHYTSLERPWDHETFMYGLGLIYMHFNAYNWAVKSFRDVVYVEPGYRRSRDIHTRLGLIYKTTGRYRLSKKHFNLAINDARPDSGTCTNLELRFHLAHLSEIQGKTKQAIELYEELLQERDLPPKLSANIHRQLGWIHYLNATKSGSPVKNESRQHKHNDGLFNHSTPIDPRKLDAALNYLNTSYKTDSDSQTSYCLGRCLTSVGKFQDAFSFYRSLIDKQESTADTWCSVGVSYQRQNQPWDALQAYIRSVQYDKKHEVAWMNLGILYESHNQFKDALKCYQHVLRSNTNGDVDRSLLNRVIYIQKHINDIETASTSNNGKSDINSDKLLSLEDLWNMESKTNQESSASTSNSNKSDNNRQIPAQLLLNSCSRIPNQTPEHNSIELNLTPPGSSNAALDKSTRNHIALPSAEADVKHQSTTVEVSRPCNGLPVDEVNQSFTNKIKTENASTSTDCKIEADVLGADSKSSPNIQHQLIPVPACNGTSIDHKPIDRQISLDIKSRPLDPRDNCLNQIFANGTSKDSGISSDSSTYTDCALVPSQTADFSTASYISAEQVIGLCKNLSRVKRIDINLLNDDTKPPSPYPRSPSYPPPPSEKLFPSPPSIFLDSKKELNSKKLQDICQSNPISIVRNIASVLKLDLGLFSTKTLVESNPDQQIDVVSHLSHQSNDGTPTEENSKINLWTCERHKSLSTISHYASYQVESFRQSIQEERDSKAKSNLNKESETDSNESAVARKNGEGSSSSKLNDSQGSKSSGPPSKKMRRDETKTKVVKSANMIDISDEQKWRPQLNELNKLPYYLKCVSASNMLTHIGIAVPGLNTITLSMHVPGCRIIGNKTPNNFCHINVNIGPGDYEWSAIPGEYETVLKKLCNRNGFDFKSDDWWPRVDDLQKYKIPVYRFSQRPGDLVWVNSSTFYWCQASGWANNLQWNVGPLNARQYRLAAESCEFDKLLFRKSDVPLVQMTWNMVMNINIIGDDELFLQMLNVLRRSLQYCQIVLDIVDGLKKDIDIIDGEPGPRGAKFCSLCECEVFNIIFTRTRDEAIHCIECARRTGTINDYKIDQLYDLTFLMKLYDNFIDTKRKFEARQTTAQLRHQLERKHHS